MIEMQVCITDLPLYSYKRFLRSEDSFYSSYHASMHGQPSSVFPTEDVSGQETRFTAVIMQVCIADHTLYFLQKIHFTAAIIK